MPAGGICMHTCPLAMMLQPWMARASSHARPYQPPHKHTISTASYPLSTTNPYCQPNENSQECLRENRKQERPIIGCSCFLLCVIDAFVSFIHWCLWPTGSHRFVSSSPVEHDIRDWVTSPVHALLFTRRYPPTVIIHCRHTQCFHGYIHR